uniref:Polycomb group protein EMBRYONIC FLOWER 2-like n=1 Tax=Rhizophora mucronata TaxID=61149 RepID=A0A2P2MKH7_RHIMU
MAVMCNLVLQDLLHCICNNIYLTTHSDFLFQLSSLTEDRCVSIQIPHRPEAANSSQQVHVNISAEEVGARERSPYHSFPRNDISSSSLSHIIRLRAGNVIFNYRYYNNRLHKTEVTEDFSCPFCLVKCTSFKGLRYHLPSSHDFFNFEFWVTEDFQAVNISVKTDVWRSEIVAEGVDPKQQTFFFCSKKPRRKRPKSLFQNSKHVHPLVLESNLRVGTCELVDKSDECAEQLPYSLDVVGVSGSMPQVYAPECVQSVAGNSLLTPPAVLQFAKTRKLSIERSELRNRTLLHKRQFFHSHRAQMRTSFAFEANGN